MVRRLRRLCSQRVESATDGGVCGRKTSLFGAGGGGQAEWGGLHAGPRVTGEADGPARAAAVAAWSRACMAGIDLLLGAAACAAVTSNAAAAVAAADAAVEAHRVGLVEGVRYVTESRRLLVRYAVGEERD